MGEKKTKSVVQIAISATNRRQKLSWLRYETYWPSIGKLIETWPDTFYTVAQHVFRQSLCSRCWYVCSTSAATSALFSMGSHTSPVFILTGLHPFSAELLHVNLSCTAHKIMCYSIYTITFFFR